MISNTELLRDGFAYLLLAIAAGMFLIFLFRNLQLTLENMRGKPSLFKDKRVPLRYAILATFSILLAIVGGLLLVPRLKPLAPSAVVVALLIGLLVWVNLRLRFYIAERVIFRNVSQAERDTYEREQ